MQEDNIFTRSDSNISVGLKMPPLAFGLHTYFNMIIVKCVPDGFNCNISNEPLVKAWARSVGLSWHIRGIIHGPDQGTEKLLVVIVHKSW